MMMTMILISITTPLPQLKSSKAVNQEILMDSIILLFRRGPTYC